MTIRSPSGRMVSSQTSGLATNATIPIAGEYGNYTIMTKLDYNYSCIHWSPASWANQVTYTLPIPTYLRKVGNDTMQTICNGEPDCGGTYEYRRTRTWGVYDQNNLPYTYLVRIFRSQWNTGVNSCHLTPITWAPLSNSSQGHWDGLREKGASPAVADVSWDS